MKSLYTLLFFLFVINFSLIGQDASGPFDNLELLSGATCEKPSLDNCSESDASLSWNCTLDELVSLITSNIKYPGPARENELEGTALIQFHINASGRIVEYEVLHHLGQGTDRALHKMYKKAKFNELQFVGLDCSKEDRILQLKIPVTFKLEGGSYPILWNIEQLFCERSQHFVKQSVRAKRFKKYLKEAGEIHDFWLYEHGLSSFDSFDVVHATEDGSKLEYQNMTSLNSEGLEEIKSKVKRGDALLFRFHDSVKGESRTFKKVLLIR